MSKVEWRREHARHAALKRLALLQMSRRVGRRAVASRGKYHIECRMKHDQSYRLPNSHLTLRVYRVAGLSNAAVASFRRSRFTRFRAYVTSK